MLNSLEAYAEQGDRYGKALRYAQSGGSPSHEYDRFQRMLAYESVDADRAQARESFETAARAWRSPMPR